MRPCDMFGILVFALLVVPAVSNAAFIFLDPAEPAQNRHDTFYVPIRIDPQGQCINAMELALAYDPSVLSVQDIATGDSIVTLWTVRPHIEKDGVRQTGRVLLSGGIPGGYCGRVEGDPGTSDVLARLVLTGTPTDDPAGSRATTSIIVEPGASVYPNDGSGQPAPLTVLGANIELVVSTTSPQNQWLGDVRDDRIAPEFFDITLVEGPSAGNAKHYIVFNTQDKQSGIDHYQVLETDPDQFGFLTWVSREAYWVRAESPYVLRDQKLTSKIMVKAVDKNGNERIAEYVPPMSFFKEYTRPVVLVPLVVAIVLLVVVLIIVGRLVSLRRKIENTDGAVHETQEHHE